MNEYFVNNWSISIMLGINPCACHKILYKDKSREPYTVVIEQCRYFFHIELPSVHLQRRFENFLANAADKVY